MTIQKPQNMTFGSIREYLSNAKDINDLDQRRLRLRRNFAEYLKYLDREIEHCRDCLAEIDKEANKREEIIQKRRRMK